MIEEFSQAEYEQFMQFAINEAKKGIYSVSPNPAVGCVLVKNKQIIGVGFHKQAGDHHAEVNAIHNAKNNGFIVAGSTAFVTLEPCNHFGKTPPCTKLLIDEKIAKVVIGSLDKNPKVNGLGIKTLEQAGIIVVKNILTNITDEINKAFFKTISTSYPFVRLKMAMSLDGKIAMQNGESKWITGKSARFEVQKIRALSDAIITSSKTVIADNAKLTVREDELFLPSEIKQLALKQKPLRVLLDKSLTTPRNHVFFDDENFLIATSSKTNVFSEDKIMFFQDKICLREILQNLHSRNMNNILVEAGSSLAGSFIQESLVDELHLFIAPKILGSSAQSAFQLHLDNLKDAFKFSIKEIRQIEEDCYIIANFN